MFKKILISLAAIVLAFTVTGMSLASEEGNERKGKYTYRNIYKSCSKRGEVDSPKPPISPDEKTKAQWQRVFDKKDFEQFGCASEWNNLSETDLADIFAYMYAHAADSPAPAKCK